MHFSSQHVTEVCVPADYETLQVGHCDTSPSSSSHIKTLSAPSVPHACTFLASEKESPGPVAEFHPIEEDTQLCWAFITQSGFRSTKEKVRDPTTAHQAGVMWERCKKGMLILADKTLKTSLRLLCLPCYGPVDEPVLTWKLYKPSYACPTKLCISWLKRRVLTSQKNRFNRMKVLLDSHEIISHFLKSSQFLPHPFRSSESVGNTENYSQRERG